MKPSPPPALPDIHNSRGRHPTTSFNTLSTMSGPTAQLRDLIRSYHPVQALRETLAVLIGSPNTYGPPLSLIMREYDRIVEAIAAGGVEALPDVTLFEDVAAANEKYIAEKHNINERKRLEMENGVLEKRVLAISTVLEGKIKELSEANALKSQGHANSLDLRVQTASLSMMLKQTKEEVKRITQQHTKVYHVHNAAIANMEKRGIERAADLNASLTAAQKKYVEVREQAREVAEQLDQALKDISVLENRVIVFLSQLEEKEATIQAQCEVKAQMAADYKALEEKLAAAMEIIAKEKALQEREHDADLVPEMNLYITTKEAERIKPNDVPKSFPALGTAEDVPIFLSGTGRVDNVNLSYSDAIEIMEHTATTLRSQAAPHFFQSKLLASHSGDAIKALQTAYSIVNVAASREWETKMECLKSVLYGTCPAVVYRDMIAHACSLRNAIEECQSGEEVRRALLVFYPRQSDQFLAALFAALQRDLTKGDLDVYDLTNPSQEPMSFFLNEVHHLFYTDALEFRTEVNIALNAAACDAKGLLTFEDAVRALRKVDPECPLETAQHLIATAVFSCDTLGATPPPPVRFRDPAVASAILQASILRVGPRKVEALVSMRPRATIRLKTIIAIEGALPIKSPKAAKKKRKKSKK